MVKKKKKAARKIEASRKAGKKKEIFEKSYLCANCNRSFLKWSHCLEHMGETNHFPPNWDNLMLRLSNYASNDSLSKPVEVFSSNIDAVMALRILRLLCATFGDGAWPRTRRHLKAIALTLCKDNRNKILNEWIETCERTQKNPNYAINKLEHYWTLGGCLLSAFEKCFWNSDRIRSILETNADPVNITDSNMVDEDIQKSLEDMSHVRLVDTAEKLEHTIANDPIFRLTGEVNNQSPKQTIAIFCESVPGQLLLIQVATNRWVYVFDCVKLRGSWVCSALAPMFAKENIQKLIHDSYYFLKALSTTAGLPKILGAIDTQLAMELVTGEVHMSCNNLLLQLGIPTSDESSNNPAGPSVFHRRPLSSRVIMLAAKKASRLLPVYESLESVLDEDGLAIIKDATLERFKRTGGREGFHWICFDVANGFSIASPELMALTRPHDMLKGSPLKISSDINDLLDLLPETIAEELSNRTQNLSDVVFDLGRAPQAWIAGKRVFLHQRIKEVQKEHILAIAKQVGCFGSSNRAVINRQLHRVSGMRNLSGDIIGVTMRVGRYVIGNANMVSDILCGGTRNVLLLGERGTGKTTILRDVCRLLAGVGNVCVVDTRNEIAGDGDIPHSCIGGARRIMVPSLSRQSALMLECVKNHTPSVIVIDEIGRPSEVEGTRAVKHRGVRMVAGAYGTLRTLIENRELRDLVGGVETVIVGDKESLQRVSEPIFDVIIELTPGEYHEWRVVLDATSAVDAILRGERYSAEIRSRNPLTGQLWVAKVEG